MASKYPFSYTLLDGTGQVCKFGKGTATSRTDAAAAAYLNARGYTWTSARVEWHDTGAAALKAEKRKEESYARRHGALPRGSRKRAGGGRRAEPQCKATKRDGRRCRNRALQGNYGFCGIHR